MLYGGVTVGVLGEWDGMRPVVIWGTGADVSGGNAAEGCKFDPVLPNQEVCQTIPI